VEVLILIIISLLSTTIFTVDTILWAKYHQFGKVYPFSGYVLWISSRRNNRKLAERLTTRKG